MLNTSKIMLDFANLCLALMLNAKRLKIMPKSIIMLNMATLPCCLLGGFAVTSYFAVFFLFFYLLCFFFNVQDFPAKFANLTIKLILTSFKFAKFCRAVKITIHIHSLIIQFNFSLKGIRIYVIQFKMYLTSIQIRDRTSRRLN